MEYLLEIRKIKPTDMNKIIVSSKVLHNYLHNFSYEIDIDNDKDVTFYVKNETLVFEDSTLEPLNIHVKDTATTTKTTISQKKLDRLLRITKVIEEQPIVLDLKNGYSVTIESIEI